MTRPYSPSVDARDGYFDACWHLRVRGLIAGKYEPIDDTERAIAREGKMPVGVGYWREAFERIAPCDGTVHRKCQWIDGDPIPAEGQSHDDLYCGEPVKPGSSYCEAHHDKCWVPHVKPRKALLDPGQWDKRGRAA